MTSPENVRRIFYPAVSVYHCQGIQVKGKVKMVDLAKKVTSALAANKASAN